MICLTCPDDDPRVIHIYSGILTIPACWPLSVFATALYLVNHMCFIITHLYTMPSIPQLNSHEILISICRSLCRALVNFKEFSHRDLTIKQESFSLVVERLSQQFNEEWKLMIDWNIDGQEMANCNCNFGCPCQFGVLPKVGSCQAVAAFNITKGH